MITRTPLPSSAAWRGLTNLTLAAGLVLGAGVAPSTAQACFNGLNGQGWQISLTDFSHNWVRVDWSGLAETCVDQHSFIIDVECDGATTSTFVGSQASGYAGAANVDGCIVPTAPAGVRSGQPCRIQVRTTTGELSQEIQNFTPPVEFAGGLTLASTDGAITASWPAQAGAAGYRIEWYHPRTNPGAAVNAAGTPEANSVELAGGNFESLTIDFDLGNYPSGTLFHNENYCVRLHTILPNGQRSGWVQNTIFSGGEVPASLAFCPGGGGSQIEVSWEVVQQFPGGYQVERRAWNEEAFIQVADLREAIAISFVDNAVAPATYYYYQVRSQGDEDWAVTSGWRTGGAWSSTPPAPGGFQWTALTDTSIDLQWDGHDGVVEYVIERSLDGSGVWETVGRSSTTNFLDGLNPSFPLTPTETYRYRVRVDPLTDKLLPSEPTPLVVVTFPPAAPAPLWAVVNGGAIDLNWINVPGEDNYQLQQRSAALEAPLPADGWVGVTNPAANTNTYSIPNVTPGRYQFRIRSVGPNNNASQWVYSEEVYTTFGTPTGFTVAGHSGSAIRLTWDAVQDADGYLIQRAEIDAPSFSGAENIAVPDGETAEWIDEGLAAFTAYKYIIRSTSSGGNSGPTAPASGATLPALAATKPLVSPPFEASLTWGALIGSGGLTLTHYELERRALYGEWRLLVTLDSAAGESWTDNSVQPGESYEYRVRGKYGNGSVTPYSEIAPIEMPPPPAEGFHAASTLSSQIVLEWQPVLSAQGLTLERSVAGSDEWQLLDRLNNTSTGYTDTTVTDGVDYLYRLSSDSQAGSSSVTAPASTSPFQLAVSASATNTAALSWDPFVDGTGTFSRYLVERNEGAGWELVVETPDTTANFDPACTGMQFRVHAADTNHALLDTTNIVTFQAIPMPSPERVPVVVAESTSSIRISWDRVTGSTGYSLYRALDQGGPYFEFTTLDENTTVHIDSGLDDHTEYFYRVAAHDACGRAGLQSPQVGTRTFGIYTWNFGALGHWQNSTMWSPVGVPGPNDAAVIVNGTVEISGAVTVGELDLGSAATINGTGDTLRINRALRWFGGRIALGFGGMVSTAVDASVSMSGGGQRFLIGGTFQLAGEATVGGGIVSLAEGAEFSVLADAIITITESMTWNVDHGTPPIFKNAGELICNLAGGESARMDLLFRNMPGGRVRVGGGTFRLTDGGNSSGQWRVDEAAVLDFGGGDHAVTLDAGETFDVAGRVRFSAGSVAFAGDGQYQAATTEVSGGTATIGIPASSGAVDHTSGSLGGAAVHQVLTNYHWTGGHLQFAGGRLDILPEAQLEISGAATKYVVGGQVCSAGTATWTEGEVRPSEGAVFENKVGATFTAQVANNWVNDHGTLSVFQNAGSFCSTAPPGFSARFDVIFNNAPTGDVTVKTGRLRLRRGGQSDGGQWRVEAGAGLEFGGGDHMISIDAGEIFEVAGGIIFPSGTATFEGEGQFQAANVFINGGTASFNLPASSHEIEHSSGFLAGSAAHEITGSYRWTSGHLTPNGEGSIEIAPGATFELSGALPKYQTGGIVRNRGMTTWDEGDLPAAAGALFENLAGGTLILRADARWYRSSGAEVRINNAGRVISEAPAGGGTTNVQVDYVQTAGSTHLAAPGITFTRGLDLLGGTLSGNGWISGSVNNSGGTIRPGAMSGEIGSLQILGNYTQSATGTLAIDVCEPGAGGISHDLVEVTGQAAIDGGLLALSADCTPELGSMLPILTATGGVTGSVADFQGAQAGEGVLLEWRIDGDGLSIDAVEDYTPKIVGQTVVQGGQFLMVLAGLPGGTYGIESTTDLSDPNSWEILFEGVMPPSGQIDFAHTIDQIAEPRRFYRGRYARP